MKVTKELIFEPSAFDPPEQDQYEYWAYSFSLDDRRYGVRRYTDQPELATIDGVIRNTDEQALADAAAIARYLIENEGVKEVARYNTKTGVCDRAVEP